MIVSLKIQTDEQEGTRGAKLNAEIGQSAKQVPCGDHFSRPSEPRTKITVRPVQHELFKTRSKLC